MKKKVFLVMVVLSITMGISAQESIKLDETSVKGVYVRIGGGYSLGAGTSSKAGGLMPAYSTSSSNKSEYQSRFGTVNVNENSSSSTQSNASMSLGEGVNMTLGVGYMFNANIGFELSGDYLLGSNNIVEDKTTSSSSSDIAVSIGNNQSRHTVVNSHSSNATTYSIKRSSFALTPALKLIAPFSHKVSLYSRIGVALPLTENVVYEYTHNQSQYNQTGINNSSTISNSSSEEKQTKEFISYFKLGYTAALGFTYALGKSVCVFGEVNAITNSFEAKKGTITEWTQSSTNSNGNSTNKNLLDNIDTYDKVTEYQKKYTVTNTTPNPDKNSPKQDVAFSIPASSIGIMVGLAFKF